MTELERSEAERQQGCTQSNVLLETQRVSVRRVKTQTEAPSIDIARGLRSV